MFNRLASNQILQRSENIAVPKPNANLPPLADLKNILDQGTQTLIAYEWQEAINLLNSAIDLLANLPIIDHPQHLQLSIEFRRRLASAHNCLGLSHINESRIEEGLTHFDECIKQMQAIPKNFLSLDDTINLREYENDYLRYVNVRSLQLKQSQRVLEWVDLMLHSTRNIEFANKCNCDLELEAMREFVMAIIVRANALTAKDDYEKALELILIAIKRNKKAFQYSLSLIEKTNDTVLRNLAVNNYMLDADAKRMTQPIKAVVLYCNAYTIVPHTDDAKSNQRSTATQLNIGKIIVEDFSCEILDEALSYLEVFIQNCTNKILNLAVQQLMITIHFRQIDLLEEEAKVDSVLEKLNSITLLFQDINADATQQAAVYRKIAQLNYAEQKKPQLNKYKSIVCCQNGILAASAITEKELTTDDNQVLNVLRMSHHLHLQTYQAQCVNSKIYDDFIQAIDRLTVTTDALLLSHYIRAIVFVTMLKAYTFLTQDKFSKSMECYIQAETTWKRTPHSLINTTDLISSAYIQRSIAECLVKQYNYIGNNYFDNTILRVDLLIKASLRYDEICAEKITQADKDRRNYIYKQLNEMQLFVEEKIENSIAILLQVQQSTDAFMPGKIHFDKLAKPTLLKLNETITSQHQEIAVTVLKIFLETFPDYQHKELISSCVNNFECHLKISHHFTDHANTDYLAARSVGP